MDNSRREAMSTPDRIPRLPAGREPEVTYPGQDSNTWPTD